MAESLAEGFKAFGDTIDALDQADDFLGKCLPDEDEYEYEEEEEDEEDSGDIYEGED